MPEIKSLVEITDATYSYPQSSVEALKGINLSISDGEYVAILGCNGSGKSTLARMLSGFFPPDSGTAVTREGVLPGIVFQQPKEQIVAGVVERDTAFGPQNLDMDKSEIELRTMECLSVVSLADKALSRTFELSLGQTQRLAFSGILALFPDLLILDEVTAMLDPSSRTEILQLIDQWNRKGHTVVHITHDRDEAMKARRIVVMEKGRIIFDGPRLDFFSRADLQEKLFGDESVLYEENETGEDGAVTLRAKSISFSYPEQAIFKNISFDLHRGTLTALTGPSGCGKSTLFECLAGLRKCDGDIYAKERPVLSLQESEAALFETYAADDVAFGPKKRGVKGEALMKRVQEAMELCGLPYDDFSDRGTFHLSGGEKRKLSLAGTVALGSEIVIFDEPTSALDPISRIKVLQMMRTLARSGKTVLFSTHRMEEADFADRKISWASLTSGNQEEVKATEQNPETKDDGKLERMDVMQNASILDSLQKTSAALMAPPKAPQSPVASLPALFKTLLFLAIFIVTVASGNLVVSLSMLGASVLYALLSRYPLKKPLHAFLKLLPLLIIFAAIQFLFYTSAADKSALIFEYGILRITWSKIRTALNIFIRAPAIITILGSYIYSTTERQIMDGISALLTPLSMIKIPVRYFVLVIGIMFRFIPLLLDELSGIIKTQLIRGAFAGTRGFGKIKILIPLFVPLILQTFRKSQYLADALTARYFK